MSGWNTLHAKITDKDSLPSEEEITSYISERGPHSTTRITGDSLYVLAMRRESSHLKEFAKEYSDAFEIIAIGSGNDTGAGNDHVTFYKPNTNSLEQVESTSCPAVYNGLRIESTR